MVAGRPPPVSPREDRAAGFGSGGDRSRLTSVVGSLLLLALSPAASAPLSAQSADATHPFPTGPWPEWYTAWSPLRPVADISRRLPGTDLRFPELLLFPDPETGLFWTAGNPGALPFEVESDRANFRAAVSDASGAYRRPLDPGTATSRSVDAMAWGRPGSRWATTGAVKVDRANYGSEVFSDVLDPHTSNPYVLIDTVGDPTARTTARLEGAAGWRLGRLGAGLALGYEAAETRTRESPVPRLNLAASPAAAGGLTYGNPAGGLRAGVHVRWRQTTQRAEVVTVASPSRVFQVDGYGRQTPLDLQPAIYRRRFERRGGAVGVSVGGNVGTHGRWVAHGEAGEVTEEQSTRQVSRPPADRWDATGWSAAGGVRLGDGQPALLVVKGEYRTLSGEALRADLDAVTFEVEEKRVGAEADLRLRPAEGWETAVNLSAAHESRTRMDLLAQVGSRVRSWEGGAGAEVARTFGGGLALSLAGALSGYGPSGSVPDPDELGVVYREFLGPGLMLEATGARTAAGRLAVRWQSPGRAAWWAGITAASTAAVQGPVILPLSPQGRRSRWRLEVGMSLIRAESEPVR